ncbi:uncharacterized protein FFUJ_03976 [Fusarium fujikuroi IMI 58289]|uniref:Uncharacterized protein n=2 Tax=Fusarium fujikuroi TaxID=5127 RepID=S0DQP5_GIBF5|nr:uncharacterized protein FFUJ_03976 [Fusarium fujikuroi IMI 58289]KLP01080.1 uncharacterized protein Y057_1298 [Fusarium fujikuroi]QGI61102.1 hypothetical protein CEK27_005073 [Fusarium fujikuroi]QGI78280.1 hypothetical protein CEK25_005009 [Fusarium fujikuroi]QGI92001.1 hypothetical protein CEK26_005070 [Fusarium fujikuroi]CCT64770.1 uncharacterized protein FFUJ_03976 [Fusarium fujikuroi IMI 58289]
MKKPSPHSDDSGPSNYQKLPSIAEIIQADQYRARHSLGTPPASPSPGPSFIKEEEDPPPQPIRPLSNLPHRFRDSSTEISLPRAGSLDVNQPAQARYQHVLDRYPDNQTYKEALGQIMSLSHTIYNFAQANQSTALQQNTIPVNPVRLPREQEVSDMFRYLERTKQLLQQVGPPQTSLGLQLPNPMPIPMNASAGVSRPDLVSRHLTQLGTCLTVNSPWFFQHDAVIVVDLLLAHRDIDRIGDRLCAEIVLLIKRGRMLSEALDVIGHSEAKCTQIGTAKI